MQSVSSRIWTRVAVSISYDDNDYSTGTSKTSIDKMEEKGFKLTKERTRRYPAQTITNTDYADDIALLANAPTKVETLLHCLEWASAGISPH